MTVSRVYNFGAGPATLPDAILRQAQKELLNWQGTGMSVMEVSHRSTQFLALLEETLALFKQLLAVPDTHEVLLLGVPARYHFSHIAKNFLKQTADYIVSGHWSNMAYQEASLLGECRLAGDNQSSGRVKPPINYDLNPSADYCYFTPNETLSGLKLTPRDIVGEHGNIPLVADMTSCLLSEPIDVSQYHCIFAGAQKNIAPSGLSVVIIHKAWLQKSDNMMLPKFARYQYHCEKVSNYATPPTFNVYMAHLMLQWLQQQGGISDIAIINHQKATTLYQLIDNSDFYSCPIPKTNRSMMNVAFTLQDESLSGVFLEQALQHGLVGLKGHRSVGGMRASIYNAMPMAGVDALVHFMSEFEDQRANT